MDEEVEGAAVHRDQQITRVTVVLPTHFRFSYLRESVFTWVCSPSSDTNASRTCRRDTHLFANTQRSALVIAKSSSGLSLPVGEELRLPISSPFGKKTKAALCSRCPPKPQNIRCCPAEEQPLWSPGSAPGCPHLCCERSFARDSLPEGRKRCKARSPHPRCCPISFTTSGGQQPVLEGIYDVSSSGPRYYAPRTNILIPSLGPHCTVCWSCLGSKGAGEKFV